MLGDDIMTREELRVISGQLNSEETTAGDRANLIQTLTAEIDTRQADYDKLQKEYDFEKSEKEKFALSNSQLLSKIGVEQPKQPTPTTVHSEEKMTYEQLFKGGK